MCSTTDQQLEVLQLWVGMEGCFCQVPSLLYEEAWQILLLTTSLPWSQPKGGSVQSVIPCHATPGEVPAFNKGCHRTTAPFLCHFVAKNLFPWTQKNKGIKELRELENLKLKNRKCPDRSLVSQTTSSGFAERYQHNLFSPWFGSPGLIPKYQHGI